MSPLSFILCLCSLLFYPQKQEQNTSNRIANCIECSEIEFDFKTISCLDKCSHTFFIKNISKEDIIVQQICTTCSCISVGWDRTVIHSGESTSINVTYFSPTYQGSFNKSIIVYLSNLKKPFMLKIRGKAL